jgi:hypothetical protein
MRRWIFYRPVSRRETFRSSAVSFTLNFCTFELLNRRQALNGWNDWNESQY